MPNIDSLLKAEISRLARKEVRVQLAAVKKSSAHYRGQIAALKREVESLQRAISQLQRDGVGKLPGEDPHHQTNAAQTRRWRPQGFAKHRQRLGLSASQIGQILGVSGQSVYKWESGEVRPRRAQLDAIASIRKLGRRAALARLLDAGVAPVDKIARTKRGPSIRKSV